MGSIKRLKGPKTVTSERDIMAHMKKMKGEEGKKRRRKDRTAPNIQEC